MRVSSCCRLRFFWAALASFVLLPAAQAQGTPDPQLPSAKTFFRTEDVAAVRLSPSGAWLALTVGGSTTRRALAVVDIDNKKPPTVIAVFGDADVRSFRWVGDDRLVFSLTDGQSGSGEDRLFGPGLYSVRRDGTEMRQLIKPYREFVRRDAAIARRETLEWNHRLLSVPRDGGREVIVGEQIYSSAMEPLGMNALRLDVDTGRTRSLAQGSPAYSQSWLFDPRGEPRVIVAEHEGVAKTYWRVPGQDAWTLIATEPAQDRSFSPYYADGSGHLFVLARHGSDGSDALTRFDFAAGRPEPESIAATPGFDFSGAMIIDAEGTTVLGVRVITDAQTTVWFDPALKAAQKAVDEHLPGHVNVIATCSRCKDTAVVLVESWSDQDPGAYWLYRPATQAWQLIGRARADIDPARMATLDFHRIKARDGRALPVWVTTPAKSAPGGGGARPAVVLVHGGPWVRGTYWAWDADAQFLASRGYVVIEPEYRGSTGYGYDHFRAGWKQWEGPMQDDVADAVRWAAGKGLVDPKRVCIAGASYGGYATLMGLARYPDLYRCGVAWVAVTDPRLLFDESWRSDISEEGRKYGLPILLGDPKEDAEMLRAAAPLEHAADIRAPLLLAFGHDDRRVPLVHGTLMRDALRERGRDPEWVVYDGEGHGWRKLENRLDFWGRVERFLDKNLKGAPAAR